MNITNSKNSQFELFPGNEESKMAFKNKKSVLFKDLTLSLENIIVLVIIFIMFAVGSFSFGVERGRKIVQNFKSQEVVNSTSDKQITPLEQEKNITITFEDVGSVKSETKENVRLLNKNEEVLKIPIHRVVIDPYFTIQVASFKTMQNAEKEAFNLKEKGYEIFVLPKGNYSIVCVGKFAQRIEAKKFSMKLRNRYSDCLVRRL